MKIYTLDLLYLLQLIIFLLFYQYKLIFNNIYNSFIQLDYQFI